ncbi:MAG: FAD-dependent thymidylate synthase [Candidatus Komeilibacteria bacterium]
MQENLLKLARQFLSKPLVMNWTKEEEAIISRFFTNTQGRIFFIHTLPTNMIAVLMAMYSRMRNTRGARGMFVDSFLPQALSTSVQECLDQYDGEPDKFLKAARIKSLDDFIKHSSETSRAYETFKASVNVDPKYLEELCQAEKMRKFLSMWLDKYGHNSIARPSMVYLCFEQVSILLAKSIEWCRPGAGYIELSTRYVDMGGKDLYPIARELAEYGVPEAQVEAVLKASFDAYRELQGDDFDGPFPQFLFEQYESVIKDDSMLRQGVFGETCDVLGNLLPCATLTSLGVGISGEALPEMIRHLMLDNTPENHAAVEIVFSEAKKTGASQFLEHLELSEWRRVGWEYIEVLDFKSRAYLPAKNETEAILLALFVAKPSFHDCQDWPAVIDKLKSLSRTNFDKLSREFEAINCTFWLKMTYRGWRDLHRMGFCTHRRSLINPLHGFYEYDKPAPDILHETFMKIHQLNKHLYKWMMRHNVPGNLAEYPLALGNIIPFTVGANLRQWEFCNWQRSKPSVNHEVRQVFLKFERIIREQYPWWSDISRADMTPAYVFARGNSDIPLES